VFEIGNSLREARHRQQLELNEIEQSTKIRVRYLRALEEESFDTLPAQTYVKGFLRTYADYLGLDGQLYVDEYNSRYGVGEEEPREPVVARRSSHVRRHHRRLERRGVLFALAGIAALFALVIAAWKFSGPDNPTIPNLGTNRNPTPPAQPATPTHKKHKKAAARRPARFAIYLNAVHGNCWVEIRNWSQSGKQVYEGTIELGQAQRFVARKLWINFGNGNLSVAVNGKPQTLPGTGGRFIVTPRGMTRAA
jgi:cytoskeleton protein RodZ